MNSPKNRSALVRIAKKHCKNFLKSYNKIGNCYGYFFLQGVAKPIGIKNIKALSKDTVIEEATNTN